MPSKSIRSNSSLSNINTPVIDKYSPVVGFAIVTQILTLIIITFILNWLNKIKSCKCTNIPERNFLPEWFSFFTIWIIISLAMFIAYNANSSEYPIIFTILGIIVTIINLVMIIRLFIYIRKLKEMNCDCGLSQEENIIYYYLIIVFAFIAFAMLMGIIGMLISLSS
jgi:hypothetical protein